MGEPTGLPLYTKPYYTPPSTMPCSNHETNELVPLFSALCVFQDLKRLKVLCFEASGGIYGLPPHPETGLIQISKPSFATTDSKPRRKFNFHHRQHRILVLVSILLSSTGQIHKRKQVNHLKHWCFLDVPSTTLQPQVDHEAQPISTQTPHSEPVLDMTTPHHQTRTMTISCPFPGSLSHTSSLAMPGTHHPLCMHPAPKSTLYAARKKRHEVVPWTVDLPSGERWLLPYARTERLKCKFGRAARWVERKIVSGVPP